MDGTGRSDENPLEWKDASSELRLGAAEGSLPVSVRLRVRLIRPDGSSETHFLDYAGDPVSLVLR